MPELPEVETVLRGISPFMEGNEIEYAEVNRPDLRKPFPINLAKRLKNRKINFLHRRSKYILIDLSDGETLLMHLGMSGRILISQNVVFIKMLIYQNFDFLKCRFINMLISQNVDLSK